MALSNQDKIRVNLRARITCPHCWENFAPENALWISEHPDLLGDSHLGADHSQRFLPTRFNAAGNAIDPRGFACQQLACPKCHLSIPRALFEILPLFVSIIGTPSCGKSYFLASMTWRLRQILPQHFSLSFSDADPVSNKILNRYEEVQFFNVQQDQIVKLAKTEEQGDLYDVVRYGDQMVSYPQPFLFTLRPLQRHPSYENPKPVSRLLCLYDNAGESFEPGKDTFANPVTRHLAQSQVLMFLYDPTQDPRFRDACRGKTKDPQITDARVTSRQETVLHEATDRIRRHSGLGQNGKHTRPMIVVVTKYDAWASLLDDVDLKVPWVSSSKNRGSALDLQRIDAVSARVRKLLWRYSPELVSNAEGFAERVFYIPVTATGCAPEKDRETGQLGIRPRDIRPRWVEVPLLLTLCRWCRGVIPYRKTYSKRSPSQNISPGSQS